MNDTSNVVPFAKRRKALNARGALAYLAKIAERHPENIVEVNSITHLGTLLGWAQPRTSKAVKAWKAAGQITADPAANGKLVIRVMPIRAGMERDGTPSQSTVKPKTKRTARRPANHAENHATGHAAGHAETAHADHAKFENTPGRSMSKPLTADPAGAQEMLQNESASGMPSGMPQTMPSARGNLHASQVASHGPHLAWRFMEHAESEHDRAPPMGFMDVLIVLVVLSLAGAAAVLSVNGMQVLFGGTPRYAFFLGCALEGAKLVVSGWMSLRWDFLSWTHRLSLMAFIFGIACINAISVYSQLVASHLAVVGEEQVAWERTEAETSGKLSLAETRVNDLNRRISQLDATVEGAASRGRSKTAMSAMKSQQQERAQLVAERDRAQRELADLKTSRSTGSAKHQATINEALPIQYVAEFLGIHKGGEEVIRWLIAGIVAVTDPFALVLANALGSRRRRRRAA